MIDTPTSRNLADFKQRYLGVFGWFCNNTNKKLVYISGVNSKQVTFTDAEGAQYFAHIDAGVEFEFAPVMRGWYNTPQGVFYMCRVPARQWKRGVCLDNTFISHASNPEYGYVGEVWGKAAFNILDSQDNYISKDTQEVAYSKHFANIRGQLFLYTKPIGTVANNKVKLATPLFKQEFLDMCRRKELELEVL
jgi:hypothetical protein